MSTGPFPLAGCAKTLIRMVDGELFPQDGPLLQGTGLHAHCCEKGYWVCSRNLYESGVRNAQAQGCWQNHWVFNSFLQRFPNPTFIVIYIQMCVYLLNLICFLLSAPNVFVWSTCTVAKDLHCAVSILGCGTNAIKGRYMSSIYEIKVVADAYFPAC